MSSPGAVPPSSAPQNVVLVRVGIDSGSGGMQGPLFADDAFEFIPIPDNRNIDERTYGNTAGRHGRAFSEYFPPARRAKMAAQSMHVDPEWESFTYGDPTRLKAGLRRLLPGDLLVFYCGLQRWDEATGWDASERPSLYLAGYFTVALAGYAREFDEDIVQREFAANFHVCHRTVFEEQRETLVLVKGDPAHSRLFRRAHCISAEGRDSRGAPLKILSPEAQQVFGDFGGHPAIQRSSPRWVADPKSVAKAAKLLRSLE